VNQVELSDYRQLHIIFGMVKDKEIDNVLALLPPQAEYYFTKAQIPRALPETVLQQKALAVGLKGEVYSDVNDALKTALANASKEDLILVCGSVFVVGEVLPIHT
jgi:dihydrofolate synthase / folylpolyglutamate synthase